MADALVSAYNVYSKKYNTKRPFDEYREDFMGKYNKMLFTEKVRKQLIAELITGSLGPFSGSAFHPEFAAKANDALKVGLDIDKIWRWRKDAWERAKNRIADSAKSP